MKQHQLYTLLGINQISKWPREESNSYWGAVSSCPWALASQTQDAEEGSEQGKNDAGRRHT